MRVAQVLQKCRGEALNTMHALRGRVLLRVVKALVHERKNTKTKTGVRLHFSR